VFCCAPDITVDAVCEFVDSHDFGNWDGGFNDFGVFAQDH
jgi:hypothetical protein